MINANDWLNEVPNGWHNLFLDMLIELNNVLDAHGLKDNYDFIDVKEKYGVMRVYDYMKDYSDVPQEVIDIVRKYEELSKRICPICGKEKNMPYMCKSCEDTFYNLLP